MDIIRIVDEIEDIIRDGKRIPFSGEKSLVESNRILERLDRIRAVLPEELEKARIILDEKKRIMETAHMEADRYIEDSKIQASHMVNNSEITQNAMHMAQEMIEQAEARARETKQDADEYAAGVLTHIEIVLKRGLDVIIQGRDELRQKTHYDQDD